MPALADAIVAPRGRPGVQGIASHIDDITLRGKSWTAQIGEARLEAKLIRTIGGASTVEIEVHDHARKLLRHPILAAKYDIALDGLRFRYVKARSSGRTSPLTLVHEALNVARLKELYGPHKAFRDKVTRAEFAKRRVREAPGRPIPFICHELHVDQPIATQKAAQQAKADAKEQRGKGLGAAAHLTVKGAAADPNQIDLGETALQIAASHSAPGPVMVALMAALIAESELGAASSNVLQGTEGKAQGTVHDITGFLTGEGWTIPGGALRYYAQNPAAKPYEIAQAVQVSGAGSASDGRANYGAVQAEAAEWVEAFGGGSSGALQTTRYAFEQKEKENNWRCIKRLAGEVNWRCFESAGAIYYIDELDLLKSARRMIVSDSSPGVEDTSLDFDVGKPVNEMTVSVRARAWAAPPGSVVQVTDHGPGDGLWLVSRIEAPLARRNSVCEVALKRPTEPLPEPAPKTKSGGVKFGSGPAGIGEMGTLEGTPEEIVNQVVDYAHANGFPAVTRSTVRAANAAHSTLTSSGNISDHKGPPDVAWAADISNGVETPEEVHLAAAVAKAFGIPWDGSGLITHVANGYQLQLIFKAPEHYDHVHFGCHKL